MYLIAGLGNPGKQYEATRHNMGFDTVDCLVETHNVPQGGVKFNAMYGSGFIGGEKVIFMKPLSFMNLSRDSFASVKKEVLAVITVSRTLSAVLELKNLSVSVSGSVRSRKTGIWQILCWAIFRTVTESLWMRESVMQQKP